MERSASPPEREEESMLRRVTAPVAAALVRGVFAVFAAFGAAGAQTTDWTEIEKLLASEARRVTISAYRSR